VPILRGGDRSPRVRVQAPAPVQQVLAPNTLPLGTNLVLKAGQTGHVPFAPLDPANRLYVLLGSQIDFRVDHANAPIGLAPQINLSTSTWGGTAGAAGAGHSKTVRFNTLSNANSDLGAFTVTVTFGGANGFDPLRGLFAGSHDGDCG
jgi:hypothetical protein